MNNDRGRSTVGGLLIILAGCVAFVVLGLYFYEKREDEAYSNTLTKVSEVKALYEKSEKEKEGYKKLLDDATAEAKAASIKVGALEAEVTKLNDAMDVFRDQVMDTREKQVKLREILATKKTQVVLPQGAIQVEILKSAAPPKIPAGPPPVPGKGLGKGMGAVLKDQKTPKKSAAQPRAQ